MRRYFCWLLGHVPNPLKCPLGCYHCYYCKYYLGDL